VWSTLHRAGGLFPGPYPRPIPHFIRDKSLQPNSTVRIQKGLSLIAPVISSVHPNYTIISTMTCLHNSDVVLPDEVKWLGISRNDLVGQGVPYTRNSAITQNTDENRFTCIQVHTFAPIAGWINSWGMGTPACLTTRCQRDM
jgi:hypothetical protein